MEPAAPPGPLAPAPAGRGAARWRAVRRLWPGPGLRARLGFALQPQPVPGNRIELLVNGAGYFPALVAAIDAARRSVHLETYIFADDEVGHRVVAALSAAAARGVQVRLVVDGFGGGEFARRLARSLPARGVQLRIFRPERWWRLDRRLLRRLHRKLCVVDEAIGFVGGINVIDDHNHPEHERGRLGPRFDFAVRCEGPVVAQIALAAARLWWTLSMTGPVSQIPRPLPRRPRPEALRSPAPRPDGVAAAFLPRDNFRHRRTIERAYLEGIGAARREILIANAYFLPGRRLRAALRDAAARGVRVRLLLQGRVEYLLQHLAQQALYGQLLAAGIEIHEYLPSYLHAKVAVIDDDWATVGSSNFDPLSLLLAREANVLVRDDRFARQLRERIETAIAGGARPVAAAGYARRGLVARAANWAAYGLVRLATVVLARGGGYG